MRSPAWSQIGVQIRTEVDQEVQRVQDLGRRARVVWRDTESLHAEGLAGRARAARATRARAQAARVQDRPARPWSELLVGQEGGLLWHDDDDRARAMRILDEGFAGLQMDVEPRATAAGAPAATRQWWSVEVAPTLEEWRVFADQATQSWARRAATAWSTYEDWTRRLYQLRSLARAHNLVLASPEPVDLPSTLYQRAQRGRGSPAEAWWTLGRFALYTAVGVAGVLSLRQIMKRPSPASKTLLPRSTDGPSGRPPPRSDHIT